MRGGEDKLKPHLSASSCTLSARGVREQYSPHATVLYICCAGLIPGDKCASAPCRSERGNEVCWPAVAAKQDERPDSCVRLQIRLVLSVYMGGLSDDVLKERQAARDINLAAKWRV